MRLIAAATFVFIVTAVYAMSERVPVTRAQQTATASDSERPARDKDGQAIFRFDTFGDEQLWTDVLRMHEVIPTIDPATALAVGLKVDVDALPTPVIDALRAGQVDLTDPAVTVELLRLNAVVGVKGTVDDAGHLAKVGVTCALCHSSVDDSFAAGIGKRLDGWANTALNVGAIVALSPAIDEGTKAEFRSWGPGKYDPRHHAFDGTNLIPLNSPSLPIVIPPIYGLKGVGFETFTGDGPISYWNSYVGVGQMGGHGSFSDPRIGLPITQTPDLVTPKLAALLDYQLSLRSPEASARRFRSRGRGARKRSVQGPGELQHVPSVAEFHRRAERPRSQRFRCCTIQPKSEWIRRTLPVPLLANTGRPRSGACCGTHRTFTTAAHRICWPSSTHYDRYSAFTSPLRKRPTLSNISSRCSRGLTTRRCLALGGREIDGVPLPGGALRRSRTSSIKRSWASIDPPTANA